MDFDFTPEQQRFRAEARAWLAENVPPDLKGRAFAASRADRHEVDRLREWQRTLHKAGYVGLDWPAAYGGRGVSIMEQIILYEEMSRTEAPQPVNRGGISMLGPTLMTHGTAAQKARHLGKILNADEIWCQGFSEPNAGSDLASVETRATPKNGYYVINGHDGRTIHRAQGSHKLPSPSNCAKFKSTRGIQPHARRAFPARLPGSARCRSS